MGIASAGERGQLLSGLFQQLGIALVAGFFLWLASKIFYQRRLFYVVQNLFDHSKLSDGGTVEIVVANLGRRPEEEIQLGLVPGFRYELVAATSPDIEIDASRVIRIPRLAPKQQLTLLILAEGSQRFGDSHVTGLSSRDVVGKSAKNMSEAHSSDPLAAILVFGVIGALVAMGGAMGYVFGKDSALSLAEAASKEEPKKEVAAVDQPFELGCADFQSNGDKKLSDDVLKRVAVSSVQITKVIRRGDLIAADVKVENLVEGETEYSVSLKSPASDSSTEITLRADSFIYDIVLMEEGATRTVSVSNYLPESYKPQVFWVETRLEIGGGYWVTYRQRVSFGRDVKLICPSAAKA